MEIVKINFKSVSDFRSRIAQLWQNQKENETFEFTFANEEVEKEFIQFIGIFDSVCQ